MSKLKEKELLEEFEYFTKNISKHITSDKHSPLNKHGQACAQIVALIKIFFAKEISTGPIKEDISRPDLTEWLQGINQSATAVNDYYVMKATTQLIKMIQKKPEAMKEFIEEKAKQLYTEVGIQYREILDKINIEDFIRRLLEEAQGMGDDWLPTPGNINALPEPVRKYIADLETNADPPSMVADNIILRDTIKALEIKLEEKIQVHDELLIKYTEKFREDYERGFCSRNNYKGRLKQFSQEAGLEVVK